MNGKIKSVSYIRSANKSEESLDSQRSKCEVYAEQNLMSISIKEYAQSSGATPFDERAFTKVNSINRSRTS
ncbi:hypothetical protein JOC85_003072 [Bacillus mesophilus]|nr:hypothetical protein [Bacillus mesophilus]